MLFSKSDIVRILKESEKYNLIFLFAKKKDAIDAANELRRNLPDSVNTKYATILQMPTGRRVYFKSVQFIEDNMSGIEAKVIICIPILEYASRRCGGVWTMKQFKEQEGL